MFYHLEKITVTTAYTRYFPPKLTIKGYNVMIDGRNFFDQLVENDIRAYDNILKITTNWSRRWLQNWLSIFKEHFKIKAIVLSKQQALDADSQSIQKMNFTGKLIHYCRSKIINFRYFTRKHESFVNSFYFNLM